MRTDDVGVGHISALPERSGQDAQWANVADGGRACGEFKRGVQCGRDSGQRGEASQQRGDRIDERERVRGKVWADKLLCVAQAWADCVRADVLGVRHGSAMPDRHKKCWQRSRYDYFRSFFR